MSYPSKPTALGPFLLTNVKKYILSIFLPFKTDNLMNVLISKGNLLKKLFTLKYLLKQIGSLTKWKI